jgi:signal transduction histidine kinase
LERAVYCRKADTTRYVAASIASDEAVAHSFLIIGGGTGQWIGSASCFFFVRSMSVNQAELAAILSRLETLENKFQEALEAEKLEAMAEFAAGAGHEINNPLTIIAGRAQLFLHGETDPERRRSLALVNSQAMRIYEMIADMMLFARPPQPNFALVDAANIIDETIADLQTAAAGQETVLSRRGQSGPLEIEADATQIAVAIRALCQNSLEALSHGGHIEIDLQTDSSGVMIRVSDDGPGITPEQRRHIFDPFFSARQAGRGLGLGLSKCWRIVTNHGGRIEVESRPGQGATFVIILPKRQKDTKSEKHE